jgi:hypothetical protein
VPILHAETSPPASLVELQGQTLHFGFDLVQAAFWLLCRCEEMETKERDRFGRFPEEQSWLIRHGLAQIPVLNMYAALLRTALATALEKRGMTLIRKARWPGARPYAVVLSHDVDDAGRFDWRQGFHLLARAVRQRSPRGLLRGVYLILAKLKQSISNRRDPYWNFDTVTELEDRHGFRSSFYFVTGPESVNRDPLYHVDAPRIAQLLVQLHEGGWEVGVHGSFDSYLHAAKLQAQRKKLESLTGSPVRGIRQHYLRLKVPETFREQVRAGFTYDSTLGYRGHVGFRAGAAFPFPLFDPQRREPIDLLEVPLSIMDGPLFWQLDLGPEEAAAYVLDVLRHVREQGGLAVLLWHQRVWYDKKYPGWSTVYEAAIEYLHAEQAAWVVTGAQVAEWWLAREEVRPVSWERADQEARLSYRAGRPVEGLVLEMDLPPSARVVVTGIETSIRREGTHVQIDLPPLIAGQTFDVHVREEGAEV